MAFAHRMLPASVKSTVMCQPAPLCRSNRASATLDVVPPQIGGLQSQELPRLVRQDAFGVGVGCGACGAGGVGGRGLTEYGVDGELCGAAEDVRGLDRVLDAGQFDEDAVIAGAHEGGLGEAECVDAAAQYLHGAVGGFTADAGGGGGAGLQHDLGAAAQVESEADRHGEGDGQCCGDHGEDEQGSRAQ